MCDLSLTKLKSLLKYCWMKNIKIAKKSMLREGKFYHFQIQKVLFSGSLLNLLFAKLKSLYSFLRSLKALPSMQPFHDFS